jgi:hypothetical protein
MAGQLINRGNNKWRLWVSEGRNANAGARRYKSITFRAGINQAQVELGKLTFRRYAQTDVQTVRKLLFTLNSNPKMLYLESQRLKVRHFLFMRRRWVCVVLRRSAAK